MVASAPRASCLVDHGGTLAVVPHPGHEIFQPGPGGRRERISGVSEIMQMQAGRPDRGSCVRPPSRPVEVPPAHRAAHRPREDQGVWLGLHERHQVLAKRRNDHGRDADHVPGGFDLGGPRLIFPPGERRSLNACRPRTLPASRRRRCAAPLALLLRRALPCGGPPGASRATTAGTKIKVAHPSHWQVLRAAVFFGSQLSRSRPPPQGRPCGPSPVR